MDYGVVLGNQLKVELNRKLGVFESDMDARQCELQTNETCIANMIADLAHSYHIQTKTDIFIAPCSIIKSDKIISKGSFTL